MTPDFSATLTARLAQLTGGELFDHAPSGEKRPPQVVETMLPPRDRTYEEFGEMPLVCWAIHEGTFEARRPAPFSVAVTGAIWTPGTIVDGTRDIMRLARALGNIVQDRKFSPYRLETPVQFKIGDTRAGNEGLQPHPTYWLTMQLNFLMP
jgi:hypothetical protein